jgi:serine/threonine-protein kinase
LSAADFLDQVCGDSLEEIEKDGTGTRVWKVVVDEKTYFLKLGPLKFLIADREICRVNLHRAIPKLHNAIETSDGMLLVFDFVDGTALDPSERIRFFELSLDQKLAALSVIFEAKLAIVEAGWISVDFYEGNVIYNFETEDAWVFDFEFYECGDSYILQMDKTYGSSRLRPPEEYHKGERIDQRANVFTLGRYAICALSDRIEENWREGFQGSTELADVIEGATQADRGERYDSVRDFVEAFIQIARR